MACFVPRSGDRASCLRGPMQNLCLFEPRIQNFSSSAGSSILAPNTPTSSANGTIVPHRSTDESINKKSTANRGRFGLGIVRSLEHDWTRSHLPTEIASRAPFHRMLLDAPCSNTGVMQRRVDARWRLQPSDFVRMQQRQLEIICALLPLLKQEGTLVYSTCSLEPEENEQVVQRALTSASILRLEEQKRSLPFQDGLDGAFAAKFIRSA